MRFLISMVVSVLLLAGCGSGGVPAAPPPPPPSSAPVAMIDNYALTQNTTLTVAAPGVLANDTDPSGLALIAVQVGVPGHGTLTLSANGSFTYTPATGYFGADSFSYTASNGTSTSATTTVSLTVNQVPPAVPVALGDAYTVTQNTTLSIAVPGVLANDTDPNGLALTAALAGGPAHGSLTLNTNGSFTYTPTAGYFGADSFTYSASNGITASAAATVSLSVTQLPPVASGDSYSLNQDATLTVAAPGVLANDTDPNGLALTATVVGATAHGTLTLNTNGSFSYTPTAAYIGADSFTYRASNVSATSTAATVNLTVNEIVPPAPPVTANDAYTLNQNTTLTVAAPGVLANDTDPNGLAFTAAVLAGPAHGTLTLSANGSFTYVPTAGYFGADSFTYRASNVSATSAAATVSLTVNQIAPTAPTAVGDSYSVNQNTTLTTAAPGVLANDNDPNGLALTAALVTGPAHGTLTLNANGSFTYTPTAAYFGADSFSYIASNGTATSAAATVSLTVTQRPPVATGDSYTVGQGATLTIAAPGVLANDTDPSGLALTAVVVNGPGHGTLTLNANGGFTYTPTAIYSGADSFTYRASNGTLTSTAAIVNLSVTQGSPVAAADSYTVNQNTTLTVAAPGVLSNDTEPSGLPLNAVLVSAPSHGTLSLGANGGFTYTPTTAYFGADSFTYRASNGTTTSAAATVSLTVTQRPPVATADSYTVNENATLTIAAPGVLSNDSDPSNQPLTAAVVSSPSHGTLTLNANGSFVYTPTTAYFGADSFTYRASNSSALTSTAATVSLTVTQLPPVATADGYSVARNATLTVAAPGLLTNDTDPSGLALTASQVTGPTHGTLSLSANGSFVYTPTANYTGADSFTYRASNGTLTSAAATVSITVNSGSGFGIDTRPTLAPLNFPSTGVQTGDVAWVKAFPNLSFNVPVFLTTVPGDNSRAFVATQGGQVLVFNNTATVTSTRVFLDLTDRTKIDSEEGLLGFAFDPDYATNGFVYAHYVDNVTTNPELSTISRFHVTGNPDVVDRSSELKLIQVPQTATNHKGGWIGFGPDKKLYITLGDGGQEGDPNGNGQNLNTPLGKILRINTDGTIPADNPFVGQSSARAEIWAYGLRNPFRASFDVTGQLWAGDVGQDAYEEVDIITKGGNYGWNVREGLHGYPVASTPKPQPNNFIDPILEYDHGNNRCSVIGGYVYRGSAIPSLGGLYIYADYCNGQAWALPQGGGTPTALPSVPGAFVTSFGVDAANELYVTTLNQPNIYKLAPNTSGGSSFPQKLSQTGLFSDTANMVPASGLIEYLPNATFWSDGARKRRWVAIPNGQTITFSATGAFTLPPQSVTVKYFEITLADGSTKRLETRVMLNTVNGWQGYDYKWNDAGTDADLLTGGQTITLATPNGGQTYEFPDSAACLTCHTSASGYVLGVRANQLNGNFTYPGSGVTDNQLRTLNHIGLFNQDIGVPSQYPALVSPLDTTASLSSRARAYLETNCAQCHLPGGPTPVNMDLRAATPVANMNTVNVPPSYGSLGLTNAQRIAPGVKESSVLWERMRRLDSNRMPPIASHVVDQNGVSLIGQWIDAGAN